MGITSRDVSTSELSYTARQYTGIENSPGAGTGLELSPECDADVSEEGS
jgi:hypothetical protein